jgi:hypothetical protein
MFSIHPDMRIPQRFHKDYQREKCAQNKAKPRKKPRALAGHAEQCHSCFSRSENQHCPRWNFTVGSFKVNLLILKQVKQFAFHGFHYGYF